jgi:hypothetical protein
MSAIAWAPAAAGAAAGQPQRLLLRLAAFFGLAAFVSLRYAALVTSPPAARVVLVAGCATAGCAALALSDRVARPGVPGNVLRVLLLLATLALSILALGVPAHLLAPAGWDDFAAHVQAGLAQMDDWLWPYRGQDTWARTTVLLVIPPALVLSGAVCFWPSPVAGGARRALALLALVGVFLAGAANTPAPLPAFQGLLLLALIAAALLPGAAAPQAGRAARWLIACTVGALIAQAALSSARPWLDYRDAGATAGPSGSFQWDQRYGPIRWSRSGATMLILAQPHPTLVRVTSLDRFDGLRFLRSDAPPGSRRLDLGGISRRRSWAQRATVEIAGLRSRGGWRAVPAPATTSPGGSRASCAATTATTNTCR